MARTNKIGAMIKDAAILFLITLVAGILLGLFNDMTKDIIAEREAEDKRKACAAVMSAAETFEADASFLEKTGSGTGYTLDHGTVAYDGGDVCRVSEVLTAKAADGSVVGHVVTVTSKNGYGGDVNLLVGVGTDGSVTGVEILSMSESPGLGDNAKRPEFRAQYVGNPGAPFVVKKGGASAPNEIDALSGATITSTAVTRAVNAAMYITDALPGEGGR